MHYLVNPFDLEQIKRIEEFEKEQGIHTETLPFCERVRNSDIEENYRWRKRESNEIEEDLALEKDSKVVDSCHIYGEKDMKRCRITFAPIKTPKRRKLLSIATDYAMETLGMQEVFINVSPEDKQLMNELSSQGYENLGEESGIIIFLKEKEVLATKGSNYETIQI